MKNRKKLILTRIHYILFYIVFIFLTLHLFRVAGTDMIIYWIQPVVFSLIPIALIIISIINSIRSFIKHIKEKSISVGKLIENHIKNIIVLFFSVYAIFEFTKDFGLGIGSEGYGFSPRLPQWVGIVDDIVVVLGITSACVFFIGLVEFLFSTLYFTNEQESSEQPPTLNFKLVVFKKFSLLIIILSIVVPICTFFIKEIITQPAIDNWKKHLQEYQDDLPIY